MADEISPTIEEPTVEEAPAQQEPEQMSEEAQLLELLKTAGMTKKEQVEGAIRNATRTYEMQSERDQLAAKLADLERAVSANANKEVPRDDEYGQPVDLTREMNKILDARDAKKEREQFQRQQQMMQAWNSITNDKDYHLIKDVWEKKLQDPNFVMQIQMGQTDPNVEYMETLREFYKGIARKSVKNMEKLMSTNTNPAPVHVESGDARTPSMPSPAEEASEHEQLLKQYGESADKGKVLSSDEELEALRAALLK